MASELGCSLEPGSGIEGLGSGANYDVVVAAIASGQSISHVRTSLDALGRFDSLC